MQNNFVLANVYLLTQFKKANNGCNPRVTFIGSYNNYIIVFGFRKRNTMPSMQYIRIAQTVSTAFCRLVTFPYLKKTKQK